MLPGHTRRRWKELQNNISCLHTIKCVGPGREKLWKCAVRLSIVTSRCANSARF